MNEKIKTYTVSILKEVVAIIAGILIALFIDGWNENRKEQNYLEQIFLTIHSELKETASDIDDVLPRQKIIIDSLTFYSQNSKVSIIDVIIKCKGVYIPTIKTNAWKTLSNSKIDLVSHKQIMYFSNIEEQKAILTNKSDHFMTFLYSNFHETEKNKKETLQLILQDIIQTEKTIQELIKNREKE